MWHLGLFDSAKVSKNQEDSRLDFLFFMFCPHNFPFTNAVVLDNAASTQCYLKKKSNYAFINKYSKYKVK